jgi:hypothetical protein
MPDLAKINLEEFFGKRDRMKITPNPDVRRTGFLVGFIVFSLPSGIGGAILGSILQNQLRKGSLTLQNAIRIGILLFGLAGIMVSVVWVFLTFIPTHDMPAPDINLSSFFMKTVFSGPEILAGITIACMAGAWTGRVLAKQLIAAKLSSLQREAILAKEKEDGHNIRMQEIEESIRKHFKFLFDSGFVLFKEEFYSYWEFIFRSDDMSVQIQYDRGEILLSIGRSDSKAEDRHGLATLVYFVTKGAEFIGWYVGQLSNEDGQLQRLSEILNTHFDEIREIMGINYLSYEEPLQIARQKVLDLYLEL